MPTFPATIAGTTQDATVERLDPQVSQCGQIAETVWYRIDQAPDGSITLSAQGAGLTPVIRVYRSSGSALNEIDCAAARAAGQQAQVSFDSVRGATFLVIVGKKPATATGAFTFDAGLALPPANDSQRSAQPLGGLPAKVSATTVGATHEASDPQRCSDTAGSLWYTLTPKQDGRVAFRLHALGDLDAVVAVLQRVRSQWSSLGCASTDSNGNAAVPLDLKKGVTYTIVVAAQDGSASGDFVLEALKGQPAELAPGVQLTRNAGQSTVNGLTDVNDMWWKGLQPGQTYRIAFTSSNGCATLRLFSLRNPNETLGAIQCGGYREFTPGPDGGGKYVFEVRAGRTTATQRYHLEVAPTGVDDLGVGFELANLATMRGSLSATGVDQVDRYHFDVPRTADVRIRLQQPAAEPFLLGLATDDGRLMGWTPKQVQRQLLPGRYVLAVIVNRSGGAKVSGPYKVSLVVRELTRTTMTLSGTELLPGRPLTIHATTTPSPDGGALELQIDRFDPWTGWQFFRLVHLRAPSATLTWTPPALGRWRVRATYLGNLHFSGSRAGYTPMLVAKPIR